MLFAKSLSHPNQNAAGNMAPSSLPPILPSIKPDQPLGAHCIPLSEQARYIHIQRTIRLGVREQLVDGSECLRYAVRGRPRRLEQIQTDLSSLPRQPQHFSRVLQT